MSIVQQLNQTLLYASQDIDTQIMHLHSYVAEIDKVINVVNSSIAGSPQQYDTKMLQQLQQTKAQIDQSIGILQSAKLKIQQTSMWT